MKVKTPKLSGMALCYAVCMIEMPHLVWGETIGTHHASNQIVVPELPEPKCYSPFTGWDMFGPIIEREGIDIQQVFCGMEGSFCEPCGWQAVRHTRGGSINPTRYIADTPLIAAMRCLVASKLGDEMEIPEELCK